CADGYSFFVQCENSPDVQSTQLSAHHKRAFSQSSAVVHLAWHPGASSNNAPAYCFVASVRDCPVKLLDASDGRVEFIYIFVRPLIDLTMLRQPGEGGRPPTTPSKNSKDGLKRQDVKFTTRIDFDPISESGIISSVAFSSCDHYAIGSLTPSQAMDNIALRSESNQAAIMPIGGADSHSGVTQACRLKN
ncbi:hypothetical protein EV424DRAFT_1393594, partial [Suillus variegatus]